MAVKINGINHCAISVADIEETIQWYHDVFGFTVVNRSEIPGAGIKVAHLQGVGFLLEVFEAPRSQSTESGSDDTWKQAYVLWRAGWKKSES